MKLDSTEKNIVFATTVVGAVFGLFAGLKKYPHNDSASHTNRMATNVISGLIGAAIGYGYVKIKAKKESNTISKK